MNILYNITDSTEIGLLYIDVQNICLLISSLTNQLRFTHYHSLRMLQ